MLKKLFLNIRLVCIIAFALLHAAILFERLHATFLSSTEKSKGYLGLFLGLLILVSLLKTDLIKFYRLNLNS